MIITRGKFKGHNARFHQASNDWISADIDLGAGERKSSILNPTSVELTADELDQIRKQAGGTFWREYQSVEIVNEDSVTYKLRKLKTPY